MTKPISEWTDVDLAYTVEYGYGHPSGEKLLAADHQGCRCLLPGTAGDPVTRYEIEGYSFEEKPGQKLTPEELEALREFLHLMRHGPPVEPHPFAPTRGPEEWGGKCGRCSRVGGDPIHSQRAELQRETPDA